MCSLRPTPCTRAALERATALVGVEVADVLSQAGEGAGLADDVHRQRQALGVQPLDELVDELVVGLHAGEPAVGLLGAHLVGHGREAERLALRLAVFDQLDREVEHHVHRDHVAHVGDLGGVDVQQVEARLEVVQIGALAQLHRLGHRQLVAALLVPLPRAAVVAAEVIEPVVPAAPAILAMSRRKVSWFHEQTYPPPNSSASTWLRLAMNITGKSFFFASRKHASMRFSDIGPIPSMVQRRFCASSSL